MEKTTLNTWNEVVKITKACNHRLHIDSGIKTESFASRMLSRISEIEARVPLINLSSEKRYFLNLLKK